VPDKEILDGECMITEEERDWIDGEFDFRSGTCRLMEPLISDSIERRPSDEVLSSSESMVNLETESSSETIPSTKADILSRSKAISERTDAKLAISWSKCEVGIARVEKRACS